jgi:hypothetical protein
MKNIKKEKSTPIETKIPVSNDHTGSDCDADHTGKDCDNDETETTEKKVKSKGKFNKPGREVNPDTTGIDIKSDKTKK